MTTMHTPRLYDDHMSAEISRSRAETFAAVARGIMFLFLGIAALFLSTPASAEQLGYVPNNAGGRIYLTDTVSTADGCHETLMAYSTSPAGDMLFGCWLIDGDIIMVQWSTGKVSAYPVADFLMPDHKQATSTPAGADMQL